MKIRRCLPLLLTAHLGLLMGLFSSPLSAFAWNERELAGFWEGDDGRTYEVEFDPSGNFILKVPSEFGIQRPYVGRFSMAGFNPVYIPPNTTVFGSGIPHGVKHKMLRDGYQMKSFVEVDRDGTFLDVTLQMDKVKFNRNSQQLIEYQLEAFQKKVHMNRQRGFLLTSLELVRDPEIQAAITRLGQEIEAKNQELARIDQTLERTLNEYKQATVTMKKHRLALDNLHHQRGRLLINPADHAEIADILNLIKSKKLEQESLRAKPVTPETTQALQALAGELNQLNGKYLEAVNKAGLYTAKHQNDSEVQALEEQMKPLSQQLHQSQESADRLAAEVNVLEQERISQLTVLSPLWEQYAERVIPFEKKVVVRVDGTDRYSYEWAVDIDKLRELNQRIVDSEKAIAKLRKVKEEIFTRFKAHVDHSRDILTALHGNEMVAPCENGNPLWNLWLTAKGFYVNDGAIMKTGEAIYATDFCTDMFELGEAYQTSGPAGVIVEGLRKIALYKIYDTDTAKKILPQGEVDPGSVIDDVNRYFEAQITDPLSKPQVVNTIIGRGVDTISGDLSLYAPWLAEKVYEKVPKPIQLVGRAEALDKMYKRLVSAWQPFQKVTPEEIKTSARGEFVGNLFISLAKDAVKTSIRKRATDAEVALWRQLYEYEFKSRTLYPLYQTAHQDYWKAVNTRNESLREKVALLKDLEKTRNKMAIEPAIPLQSQQKLVILTLPMTREIKEQVRVGQTLAEPTHQTIAPDWHEFDKTVARDTLPLNPTGEYSNHVNVSIEALAKPLIRLYPGESEPVKKPPLR